MGGILEGVDLLRHTSLAVMAGLAFFYFLSLDIGDFFAVRALPVVTGAALLLCLVDSMWKQGGFGGWRGINRCLQGHFCGAFIRSRSDVGKANDTTPQQDGTQEQYFFHNFHNPSPPFTGRMTKGDGI
jgi:hypothetical protein